MAKLAIALMIVLALSGLALGRSVEQVVSTYIGHHLDQIEQATDY